MVLLVKIFINKSFVILFYLWSKLILQNKNNISKNRILVKYYVK